MTMSTILVQITDHSHTLTALDAACELAYTSHDEIVLLKLVPVNHPSWLGTDDWGYMNLTAKDQEALLDYQRYAEKRGVKAEVCCLQSISTMGALVGAAENVNAQIVFAHLPHTVIPFWHLWQVRVLRYSLERQHCQLYLANGSVTPVWKPVPQPLQAHN
ncbi:MAG TPA: hypothetical protein VHP83_07445 [Aggregatilineaceae bacterium]|nr:hypothetical protein [Aggregatilineaceae bacterium]